MNPLDRNSDLTVPERFARWTDSFLYYSEFGSGADSQVTLRVMIRHNIYADEKVLRRALRHAQISEDAASSGRVKMDGDHQLFDHGLYLETETRRSYAFLKRRVELRPRIADLPRIGEITAFPGFMRDHGWTRLNGYRYPVDKLVVTVNREAPSAVHAAIHAYLFEYVEEFGGPYALLYNSSVNSSVSASATRE